ncbi:MAG: GDP-mannose 4,6 dehydratase [Candidatus Makaraimicrobium thalassicum]|nr:MAG: GDP-mannose 4,6 dehydratase [Candidatus Omnitrophota bacterium]
MSKRALITGITGFVGSHLAEYLLNEGIEVHGIVRWRSKTENIDHIKKKLKLKQGDMRDSHSIETVIKEVDPDYVYHLAAQSFVPMSWTAPADTLDTNVIGAAHLFEAIRRSECDAVVQIACSSEEYGLVYPDEVPIKETNPFRPLSPYGVSKVAEDMLGWQYFKSYGIKTVRTRAFNHTGPRRGDVFVTSNFAKQVAEIEKKKREPFMSVGNLNAQRDFTDVRDIVRAYWLAVNKCEYGEAYNICSEKARTIQSVLDLLLSMSKVKNIEVKQDPERMRPSDVEILQGDCSKFRKATGWKTEISFEKTMEDLLNYWRGIV